MSPHTRLRRCSIPLGLLLSAASIAAHADDPVIVAGIEAPEPGLGCAAAADATRVHFHFNAAAAEFGRVTIYVDGSAADPQDVDQAWPDIALVQGLHPGRNEVEVVATQADGSRVSRRMPVTLAEAGSGDGALVPCGAGAVVVEREPEVIYQERAYVHRTQVIYQDAPAYVYEPYPAYPAYAPVAPMISFDLYYSRYHPYRGYSPGDSGGGYYQGGYEGQHEVHGGYRGHDGDGDHAGGYGRYERQQHGDGGGMPAPTRGHFGPYISSAPIPAPGNSGGGRHGHEGETPAAPANAGTLGTQPQRPQFGGAQREQFSRER